MTTQTEARITCGNCKETHDSVAAVRACSSNNEPKATEKQVNYILSLSAERGTVLTEQAEQAIRNLTRQQASQAIDNLLKQKVDQFAARQDKADDRMLPEVPSGRYAVPGEDGVLRFYKVDNVTEGRWAGRTFVKVMASDNEFPVRAFTTRRDVLTEIAKDPKAAMLRYGREIGVCGHCGRTLTNEDSRAAGIGPVCAGKMGW